MRIPFVAAVFLLMACEPGAKGPDNADPCNPKPPVRCEKDGDCFPYICRTTFCKNSCESSGNCPVGYVCGSGKCVKGGTCNTCSGDYDCPTGLKCDISTGGCK
ncbi:MAG: hypothetical protein ACXWUG_12945 [Polyangiales bacterium]